MQIPSVPSTLVNTAAVSSMPTMTSRVDPAGARRMMEMLSNLYSDPKLACVREYVANAADASRVAGTDQPVEVTIPTLLEPNLVITDHGTGMSMAEVEATFLAFAASTKRDSNDQVGGLGVGAKSAWAVAESFLIDTVKNGERTIVRAAKDLTHQVMVAGEATDLPNGTTISIPISNISSTASEWAKRVLEVAAAHDPGAVIVNGKPVTSIAEGSGRIGPVLCKRISGHDTSFLVRSGGTLFESTYTINSRIRSKVKLSACVIELPIGSFDHTPSREQLIDTERTRDAIDRALEMYQTAHDLLKAKIDALAATDVTAAVKLRREVLGETASYDMLPIDLTIGVPANIGAWTARNAWKSVSDQDKDNFFATQWDNECDRTILVTGVPAGKKLRTFATYLKNNHSGVRRVIPIYEGQTGVALEVSNKTGPLAQKFVLDPSLVPDGNVYAYEQWLEVTTSSTSGGSRGKRPGYTCTVVSTDGASAVSQELSAAQIVALGLPVWYDSEDNETRHIVTAKASVGVRLGRRKYEPLAKAVPGVMSAREWHSKVYASQMNAWSHTTKLALALDTQSYTERRFKVAAKARAQIVADGNIPADILTRVTELLEACKTVTPSQQNVWRAIRNSGSGLVTSIYGELEAINDLLVASWPLIANAGGSHYNGVTDADYIDYIARIAPKA